MRTFKIHSLSSLQIHNTVLLAVVLLHIIISPNLTFQLKVALSDHLPHSPHPLHLFGRLYLWYPLQIKKWSIRERLGNLPRVSASERQMWPANPRFFWLLHLHACLLPPETAAKGLGAALGAFCPLLPHSRESSREGRAPSKARCGRAACWWPKMQFPTLRAAGPCVRALRSSESVRWPSSGGPPRGLPARLWCQGRPGFQRGLWGQSQCPSAEWSRRKNVPEGPGALSPRGLVYGRWPDNTEASEQSQDFSQHIYHPLPCL